MQTSPSVQDPILSRSIQNGIYYTQNGMSGSLDGIGYIADSPKRVSYVHTSEITGIKRMVMLERLSEPLTFETSGGQAELIYYGMFCEMSDLRPYLVCESYKGNNSVYILDGKGRLLFGDPGVDLLKSDDLYSVLGSMEYLHGGSFDDAVNEQRNDRKHMMCFRSDLFFNMLFRFFRAAEGKGLTFLLIKPYPVNRDIRRPLRRFVVRCLIGHFNTYEEFRIKLFVEILIL